MRGFAAGLALAAVVVLASESVQGSDDFRLLRLNGSYVKWGAPDLGTGARLRYAFVSTRMRFPGAVNCEEMAPVDTLVTASAIAPDVFRSEARAAFRLWEAAADITFEPSDDPDAADILIGAQANPTGWAFSQVFHDRTGDSTTRRIEKSLICLNPAKRWKIGFDGDFERYDIFYTIAHEAGHAIGLNHPGPSGQVMSFDYGELFRSLQAGDLAGAVALYGKRDAPAPAVPPRTTDASPAGLAIR